MRLMRNLCLVLCGIALFSTPAATQEPGRNAQIDALFAAYDKPKCTVKDSNLEFA